MLSRTFKLLILLPFAAVCALPAGAGPAASDPRDFDATNFGDFVTLGPNWLFAPGDNPAWASPTFDDSGWKTISTGKQLTDYGYRELPYAWYRIHIHLRPGARNVSIGITDVSGNYEVYANGVRIGGSGRMVHGLNTQQNALLAFAVQDSPAVLRGDLVLAIRFAVNYGSPGGRGTSTPLAPNSVYLFGQQSAPLYSSYVTAHSAGPVFMLCGLALLASLIAFALYFALKSQREYLAIASYLLASSMVAGILVWFDLGLYSFPVMCAQYVVLGAEAIALIEFVRLVLHRPRTRWMLALEIVSFLAFLVFPLRIVGVISPATMFVGFFLPVLIMKVVLPLLLVRGWLRGNREALLLLPAILIGSLADYWNFLRNVAFYAHLNALLPYLPFRITLGSYDLGLFRIGDFVFDVAILIFLVQRTVRIARERSQAAAELDAARTVQHVLIPDEIPTIPGFILQSVYKPAGQVGGDFFQILPLQSGGVLLVIGDVSGKGLPAAMTVSLLVGTVRTLAHYTQSPGEILTAMNQRMLTRSGGGFTTCLVLRVDKDGKLTIANAGHLSPYLAGKELPLQNGLPLGVSAVTTYIESTFHLSPTQQLTLLTDGIVEARNKAGKLFGFDRAAALSLQPAEAIAQAAEDFGQDDDITALTLARTA